MPSLQRLAKLLRTRHHLWLAYAQVAIDLVVLSACFFLSFLVRFDGVVPPQWVQVALASFPYVLALTVVALRLFGTHRFVWRYIGGREVLTILVALGLVAAVLVAVRLWAPAPLNSLKLPLGIIAINYGLSFLGICGARFVRRMQYEHLKVRTLSSTLVPKRVLLVGAGDAGRLVAREIKHRPDLGLTVVGFVDDDPHKSGRRIEGVRVLGTPSVLARLVQSHRIDLVVITFSTAPSTKVREVVHACEMIPVPVRIIPGIYEILGDRVTVSKIRDVQIEDLLAREVVQFDPATPDLISAYHGRRILVTGAGGSIGSELCRQLSMLEPERLVMLDKDENAVFEVELMMRDFMPRDLLQPVILDLRREDTLRRVFEQQKPHVVVHAAAHKHVPLLEAQVVEAVDNNVLGTDVLVRLSLEFGVQTFVMVSTDKAVNPTNVMGSTKRIAEMVVQVAAQRQAVQFSCVRFGNVLESRGSVVPIFKRQIAAGGPVTVTHPDVTRYFMTIGEAAQLIIQAGSLGRRGEIFVLEMGQPVKVIELAKDLIRLSMPGRSDEVRIEIIGLRPGEKLHEELLIAEEGTQATKFRKILIAPQRAIDPDEMAMVLASMRRAVAAQDELALLDVIGDLGIGYTGRQASRSHM